MEQRIGNFYVSCTTALSNLVLCVCVVVCFLVKQLLLIDASTTHSTIALTVDLADLIFPELTCDKDGTL